MQFLGYVITGAGIQVDPAKVEVVVSWLRPRNTIEIHSFLGLASYYRCFVQNFFLIAAPLMRLMKKGVSFQWSDECESSFQDLKSRLTLALILTLSIGITGFLVYTDASSTGLGAVLMQDDKVVAYASC